MQFITFTMDVLQLTTWGFQKNVSLVQFSFRVLTLFIVHLDFVIKLTDIHASKGVIYHCMLIAAGTVYSMQTHCGYKRGPSEAKEEHKSLSLWCVLIHYHKRHGNTVSCWAFNLLSIHSISISYKIHEGLHINLT